MLRLVAAAVLVCLAPAPAFAQGPAITVTASSADVYKSPSTGGPVIGHALRGAQLPVTRELGSWVQVAWPAAPEGVGFVHVSAGRLVNASPAEEVRAAAGDAVKLIPEKEAAVPPAATTIVDRTRTRRPNAATPAPHNVAVGGGVIGSAPVGFGVTARAWPWTRLGLRFDMSRQAQGIATSRAASLQFEPSALVSLNDYISNYLWFRPYVGGGISLRHQTFTNGLTGLGNSTYDNSTGFHVFGGTELTVANAPQLSLSADVVYRSHRTAFGAFDVGGVGIGLGLNWYLR
jgi:hypothetical protein